MNYPFENDTSAVIKKISTKKVCVLIRRKTYFAFRQLL